ncbi:MAG TPA: hypothetical protein DEA44_16700 [Firmicutes bacterium]|nr:hypothetical protein [Bacillota bacterium]
MEIAILIFNTVCLAAIGIFVLRQQDRLIAIQRERKEKEEAEQAEQEKILERVKREAEQFERMMSYSPGRNYEEEIDD